MHFWDLFFESLLSCARTLEPLNQRARRKGRRGKAGWNRPALAKQRRPNPAEVRCISRIERA